MLDVLEILSELFIKWGLPKHIGSDNGPEFTSGFIRQWLNNLEVSPLFIEPESPWENNYNKSFNGKLRDELLNGEIFYNLKKMKIIIIDDRFIKFLLPGNALTVGALE